jgi:hypothetical protein
MIQKLNQKIISCVMESLSFLRDVRENVKLVARLLLSPGMCSLQSTALYRHRFEAFSDGK